MAIAPQNERWPDKCDVGESYLSSSSLPHCCRGLYLRGNEPGPRETKSSSRPYRVAALSRSPSISRTGTCILSH
jgi:hypothetical protein